MKNGGRCRPAIREKACFFRIDYLALPILNILVPQDGQMPWVAGLPFFMVTAFASFISLFDLHLTQYASIYYLTILS